MDKMSRWGIGPIFATLSIMYSLVMILLSQYYYPLFKIGFIQNHILFSVGVVLIGIGIPFYIISSIGVMKAYNSDKLITSGIYRCCRHPLYGSWVIFIVPGTILLINSWIGLTVPLFMYFLLRVLVKKEELYLEKRFGAEYLKYKDKVPCILPYGLFIKN